MANSSFALYNFLEWFFFPQTFSILGWLSPLLQKPWVLLSGPWKSQGIFFNHHEWHEGNCRVLELSCLSLISRGALRWVKMEKIYWETVREEKKWSHGTQLCEQRAEVYFTFRHRLGTCLGPAAVRSWTGRAWEDPTQAGGWGRDPSGYKWVLWRAQRSVSRWWYLGIGVIFMGFPWWFKW